MWNIKLCSATHKNVVVVQQQKVQNVIIDNLILFFDCLKHTVHCIVRLGVHRRRRSTRFPAIARASSHPQELQRNQRKWPIQMGN